MSAALDLLTRGAASTVLLRMWVGLARGSHSGYGPALNGAVHRPVRFAARESAGRVAGHERKDGQRPVGEWPKSLIGGGPPAALNESPGTVSVMETSAVMMMP